MATNKRESPFHKRSCATFLSLQGFRDYTCLHQLQIIWYGTKKGFFINPILWCTQQTVKHGINLMKPIRSLLVRREMCGSDLQRTPYTWMRLLILAGRYLSSLSPNLVMKDESFFLTLIIPGPRSPGRDIYIYLQPLMDEWKDLHCWRYPWSLSLFDPKRNPRLIKATASLAVVLILVSSLFLSPI